MNKKIYRQYDSRWGNLPYPSKPYTLSRSGCGCVAVTHCAIERDKYKNLTPKDVRKFMVKYATKGHGTEWAGIKKGLEHYGYNVHWVKREDPMSDVWKYLKGSLIRGVILFGSSKGADGTVWTTDGHFIAFTAYKIEKGKHWFYLKDSGGRKHDGWYCYEKSMKGDVRQVWICTSLKSTPKPPATPKKTTTSTKTSTAKKTTATKANTPSAEAKKAVAWARKIAKNGGYTYKKFDVHNKKTKQCPICHKLTGKYKGWNCIGFVSAAFYHGAGVKSVECACNGIGTDGWFNKVTLASWEKRNGKGWKAVTNGGKKGGADIPASKLLAGDALICYDGGGKFHHIALYTGNSRYIDCTNTSKNHIAERPYSRLTKRYHVTRAFRYTGK